MGRICKKIPGIQGDEDDDEGGDLDLNSSVLSSKDCFLGWGGGEVSLSEPLIYPRKCKT